MATTVGQAGKALDGWIQCPSAQLSCTSCSEWPRIQKADTMTTRMDFDAWRKDRQLRRRPDARSNGRGILIKHIQSGLPKSQRNIGRYPSTVRQQHPSHADLDRLYGEQNRMWRVLAKCRRSGQVHYQVMWQPTLIVASHVEEYWKIQYTPGDVQKVT